MLSLPFCISRMYIMDCESIVSYSSRWLLFDYSFFRVPIPHVIECKKRVFERLVFVVSAARFSIGNLSRNFKNPA